MTTAIQPETTSSTPTPGAAPAAVLQTGSFFTYLGLGRVSIARGVPRGLAGGYRIYKKLAPGEWFQEKNFATYERMYREEILAPLDPAATLAELQALAGVGNVPTILCWEKPPLEGANFCHRRIVAAWFTENLGFLVPEVSSPPVPATAATKLSRGAVSLKPGVGPEPK